MTAAAGRVNRLGPLHMNRTSLLVLIAGTVVLVAVIWGVAQGWQAAGVTLSAHGWLAYGLGAVGSLALSAVLFALVFRSAHGGHDDIDRREDLDG